MPFFKIEWFPEKNQAEYSFATATSTNCEILSGDSLESIPERGKSVIYLGSIWSDPADSVSLFLGALAQDYPEIKFYFKLLVYEQNIWDIIPRNIEYNHLPLVLLKEGKLISLISSSRIKYDDLKGKVYWALR